MSRREVHSEIEITASAARVWSVLTDFSAYARWNPFIRAVHGEPSGGANLALTVAPPGQREMVFRARVLEAVPGRLLIWAGSFVIPGLLDVDHSFSIAPSHDCERVQLIQHQNFSGLLLPLFKADIEAGVRAGSQAMNRALKERAEHALTPG